MTIKIKILGLLLAFSACTPPVVEEPVKEAPPIDPKITRAAAFQLFHEKFKEAALFKNLAVMLSLCRFPLDSGEDAMTFADRFETYFTEPAIYRISGSEHNDWMQHNQEDRSYTVNERDGIVFHAKKIGNQYKIVAIEIN